MSSGLNITVSVCIATYNGAAKLPATLEGIKNSNRLPDEVVVYVDGSTDRTIEVLNTYISSLPLKIINAANCGRASARNKAFKEASGAIVLFIDDDIIIPADAIAEHIKFHEKHVDNILTCPTRTVSNRYDFSHFKVHLENRWNLMAQHADDKSFSAAFFSVHKTTITSLGGFKDGLNDAEDYEFGLRARESGITIVVNNQLLGMHNDPVNCRQFILRNRQYALANQKLVNDGTVKGSQYARQKPLWYKKTIFFFLSAKLWLNLIDGNFFVWLYQPLRYKLYEYVTAAFIYYYPGKKI